MKPRTQARALALEILYEVDLANHDPNQVLEQRYSEIPAGADYYSFAAQVVLGVYSSKAQLDMVIARFAPEWPIDEISPIDRNILRIALWEISIAHCTPLRVAINEAVELSKIYGSDSSPRFVNGVLGSIVDQLPEWASGQAEPLSNTTSA